MKASFIMPLYNQQRFVTESICSVLRQTEKDFELIIVDDGSDDESYASAKLYADVDERISLYRNRTNLNSTKTYNIAAKHAKGQYIAVTSSDDLYAPTYLERVLAQGADVVYTQYVIIDSSGSVVDHRSDEQEFEFSYSRLLEECYLFAGSMMVKRNIWENLGGYDESFVCASDWDFSIRACKDHHVALVPEPLVKYRDKHMYSNRYRITQNIRTAEKQRIKAKHA